MIDSNNRVIVNILIELIERIVRIFLPYCEDPERPTDTVYGYVPVEVIDRVIARHGGHKS